MATNFPIPLATLHPGLPTAPGASSGSTSSSAISPGSAGHQSPPTVHSPVATSTPAAATPPPSLSSVPSAVGAQSQLWHLSHISIATWISVGFGFSALVGMIYFGLLQKWTASKDFRESCVTDRELGFWSAACNETLAHAAEPPPFVKRAIHTFSRMTAVTQADALRLATSFTIAVLTLVVAMVGMRPFCDDRPRPIVSVARSEYCWEVPDDSGPRYQASEQSRDLWCPNCSSPLLAMDLSAAALAERANPQEAEEDTNSLLFPQCLTIDVDEPKENDSPQRFDDDDAERGQGDRPLWWKSLPRNEGETTAAEPRRRLRGGAGNDCSDDTHSEYSGRSSPALNASSDALYEGIGRDRRAGEFAHPNSSYASLSLLASVHGEELSDHHTLVRRSPRKNPTKQTRHAVKKRKVKEPSVSCTVS